MTTDANPTFDRESEKAQELQDRADKIYHDSLKSIDSATVRDTILWAYRNDKLTELAESRHDDCYAGSLLDGLVREYLREVAMEVALKEAENDN